MCALENINIKKLVLCYFHVNRKIFSMLHGNDYLYIYVVELCSSCVYVIPPGYTGIYIYMYIYICTCMYGCWATDVLNQSKTGPQLHNLPARPN